VLVSRAATDTEPAEYESTSRMNALSWAVSVAEGVGVGADVDAARDAEMVADVATAPDAADVMGVAALLRPVRVRWWSMTATTVTAPLTSSTESRGAVQPDRRR
jgi:hypothetical protein